MLRRLCNSGRGAFSAAEGAALDRLAAAHGQLRLDGGRLDVKSDEGYAACAAFLCCAEAAAAALAVEAVPRSYRLAFSANYQALFPDSDRHYRVDVLEASADQDPAIWVNGDKFEFSAVATTHAFGLQSAFVTSCALFAKWTNESVPSRAAVIAALASLDAAWAEFEQQYITELIDIESKARRLIVHAVEQERKLQLLELSLKSSGTSRSLWEVCEYREEQRKLAACVAKLNSVANVHRKGRDDLDLSVLESAHAALRSQQTNAARSLAQDVVGSYGAVRSYLQKVGRCLERVDPHLCNNAGLVARLADWEESWEVGKRFILPQSMLLAVCDLVAELKKAQELAPSLAGMCEDCDVELFLVLPRIIILSYLSSPGSARGEVMRYLLPHRIESMKELVSEFQSLAVAYETLLSRAVRGDAGDAFMRKVESWSLELQRHCPEDWNQLSAVLVECLSGNKREEQRGRIFQV